jgi:hypothetical protein
MWNSTLSAQPEIVAELQKYVLSHKMNLRLAICFFLQAVISKILVDAERCCSALGLTRVSGLYLQAVELSENAVSKVRKL